MSGRVLTQEIIRRKRDGAALDPADIAAFVVGLADGSVSEGQVAALAMAIFFRGLSLNELVALTRAMTASGRTLAWDGLKLSGPILDKHSTGGIGDGTSLLVAPIVAACGGFVPMISGRGLGHTGGTLDKLDSIPGYRTSPSLDAFRSAVETAGCAIIGQTDDLAPADRRMYAIRDVTGTVESLPLITASILSKKLAAGLTGLVMDVKFGSGAFMTELEDAIALAKSLVRVANRAGLPTVARLSDMNQVLGRAAGNALEIRQAVDHLTGERRDRRFHELVLALASEALVIGGLAATMSEAEARAEDALESGRAAERFAKMVAALGGPANILEQAGVILPKAPIKLPVFPDAEGRVAAIDVRQLGMAVVALGGGRQKPGDAIDPAVGLNDVAQVGEFAGPRNHVAVIHARDEASGARARETVRDAFRLSQEPVPGLELFGPRIAAADVGG